MRNRIKQILKEEFDDVVYIITSDDEKMVLTNPVLFTGQALWFPLYIFKDKFYKLGYELQAAEAMLKIQPQKYLDIYNPKIVKYNVGYFKVEDTGKLFDQLKESEKDDFDWVEGPSNEPFHKILIRGERRRPRLMDEIKTIMFNPPVEIGSRRFNKIAYWLEDHDYYPEELKLEGRTSYIQIIKQRGSNNIRNGRWRLGPELSNQELYELSQTTKNGWNYNFWEDEFIARFYDKEMPD